MDWATDYNDVNSYANIVQVAFAMMMKDGGPLEFEATSPLSELGERAGISVGGAAQDASYFLNDSKGSAKKIVDMCHDNKITRVDIDLEGALYSYPPSVMTALLTEIHQLDPEIEIWAAPECPGVYADQAYQEGSAYSYWVSILNDCPFLKVFVQTYNNWCSNYPAGSIENLLTIVDAWVNPNNKIGYHGKDPNHVVMGLCGKNNYAVDCDWGYMTVSDAVDAYKQIIRDFGCTVGIGVWEAKGESTNPEGSILTAVYDLFQQMCPGEAAQPSVSPTAQPTAPITPPTQITDSPSAAPTIDIRPSAAPNSPSSAPTSTSRSTLYPTSAPSSSKNDCSKTSNGVTSREIIAGSLGFIIGVSMTAACTFFSSGGSITSPCKNNNKDYEPIV